MQRALLNTLPPVLVLQVHDRAHIHAADSLSPTTMKTQLSVLPDTTATTQSEQELLQRLIGEGLSSTDEFALDLSRARKLLEVLFQACILNPIARQQLPTQVGFEQASLTLSILHRQTSARPELLFCLLPEPELQVPLFQWLIPRIVQAASRFDEVEEAEDLVDKLYEAAVCLLVVLGKDLSDGKTTFMRGPQRVAFTIRSMIAFCEGEIDNIKGLVTDVAAALNGQHSSAV